MNRGLIFSKHYSGFSAIRKVPKVSNKQEGYGEGTTAMWAGSGLGLDAGDEGREGKIQSDSR